MESLRGSINQLIENTLKMEQNQEKPQDPRLQQILDKAMDPCNQSQPYEEENIEDSQIEILQQSDLPEKKPRFLSDWKIYCQKT